jgi:hypothetical protein
MAYGDEFNPDEVKAYQMREFAENIGVNYKLVAQTMSKVSQAIIKVLEDDFIDKSLFNVDEKVFIDDLKEIVVKRAEVFKDVSINMSEVTY